MLGHGQKYEIAKARYAPFDRIVDPDPASRDDIARFANLAIGREKEVLVIINNKAEGSAPLSAVGLAHAIRSLRTT